MSKLTPSTFHRMCIISTVTALSLALLSRAPMDVALAAPASPCPDPAQTLLFPQMLRPGAGQDIGGNGATSSVYVIGTQPSNTFGSRVYHWNGSNWDFANGYGTRVSVDPSGQPWVVNAQGQIWKVDYSSAPTRWVQMPGLAQDIAIGSVTDMVYVIGVSPTNAKGNAIYFWRSALSDWEFSGCYGMHIAAAGANGNLFWTDAQTNIWYSDGCCAWRL